VVCPAIVPNVNEKGHPALVPMAKFFLALIVVAFVVLVGIFVFAAFTL
jgi:hypothetical protein